MIRLTIPPKLPTEALLPWFRQIPMTAALKNLSVKSTPAAVVIKYDKDGRLQWQKYLPSNNGIILSSVDTDSSGNIIAVGYSKIHRSRRAELRRLRRCYIQVKFLG